VPEGDPSKPSNGRVRAPRRRANPSVPVPAQVDSKTQNVRVQSRPPRPSTRRTRGRVQVLAKRFTLNGTTFFSTHMELAVTTGLPYDLVLVLILLSSNPSTLFRHSHEVLASLGMKRIMYRFASASHLESTRDGETFPQPISGRATSSYSTATALCFG
jgi:hypothetical protein